MIHRFSDVPINDIIYREERHDIILTDRQTGLDIYRIVAVSIVFLFHSHIHIGCDYGILNEFVQMGAIYMTAFFMISGYVLYLGYQKKELLKIKRLKQFYIKRCISIMPLYYFVALIYILFLGTETYRENLLLAPIEILGVQSVFSSIFSLTHNGGTWFVSCILCCYFIYPFLQEIIKQISDRAKVVVMGIGIFILLWSPFIVIKYNAVSIYANPFFRIIEFSIGIMLCALKDACNKCKLTKYLHSWKIIILEYLLLVSGVTVAVKLRIGVNDYMLYNWLGLPLFMLLLIGFSRTSISSEKVGLLIKYLSEISYAFFMAQFFCFKMTNFIIGTLNINVTNIVKILLSLAICFVLAILLHELIEKPSMRILKRLFL